MLLQTLNMAPDVLAIAPDVVSADVSEVTGQFSGVVFWHSLEHLRAPRSALRSITAAWGPIGSSATRDTRVTISPLKEVA